MKLIVNRGTLDVGLFDAALLALCAFDKIQWGWFWFYIITQAIGYYFLFKETEEKEER